MSRKTMCHTHTWSIIYILNIKVLIIKHFPVGIRKQSQNSTVLILTTKTSHKNYKIVVAVDFNPSGR